MACHGGPYTLDIFERLWPCRSRYGDVRLRTPKQRDDALKHQRNRPDLHEDSGTTRRRRSSRDLSKRHRKRAQLIAQIARSVQLVLANMEEEDLCALTYSHIEMVDNGSHLRVVMCAPPASQEHPVDLRALERKLNARASDVRMEVAQDIHRKRAPLLSFVVAPR